MDVCYNIPKLYIAEHISSPYLKGDQKHFPSGPLRVIFLIKMKSKNYEMSRYDEKVSNRWIEK